MIPTPIGAVVLLVCLWLMFRPAAEMFAFVLGCSILSGASAADMPVLGHSSMPPATMALAFLLLRLLRKDVRDSAGLTLGLSVNAWLLIYCVYGAATAFILPRIFANRVYVLPMQSPRGFIPLVPSSQNITQAVYILTTGLAAVAASTVATRVGAGRLLVRALIVIAWVQVATGVADVATSAAHAPELLAFARNGAYAQLSQDTGGFHRIAGLAPEASVYAVLSTLFLVVLTELWLRKISSLATGMAAFATLCMLLASTSSTAYVSVFAYALILGVRTVFVPGSLPVSRAAALLGVGGTLLVLGSAIMLLKPHLAQAVGDVVTQMTIEKGQSYSGVERGIWARQGWDLFLQTRGLGVGIGSFRSSSLITAILGSVGPACLVLLLGYCLHVLKLSRRSTYMRTGDFNADLSAAAGWAAIVQLVPAGIGAPGADPGLTFALLAGFSLAARSKFLRAQSSSGAPRGEPNALPVTPGGCSMLPSDRPRWSSDTGETAL